MLSGYKSGPIARSPILIKDNLMRFLYIFVILGTILILVMHNVVPYVGRDKQIMLMLILMLLIVI